MSKTKGRILCAMLLIGPLGCAGGSGSSAKSDPNMATLLVRVKAEPKTGWRDKGGQTSDYAIATLGMGPSYTTLNYWALDEIVVWVEPSAPSSTRPPALEIDLASPPISQLASGSGAIWRISNSGREPENIFMRSESGAVTDIGTIRPGGSLEYQPSSTGPMELMLESRNDPIARIFVAPAADVRVTNCKEKVKFTNLAPGAARITCWHPRLPGSSKTVQLSAGNTSQAELLVTVNQLPKIP